MFTFVEKMKLWNVTFIIKNMQSKKISNVTYARLYVTIKISMPQMCKAKISIAIIYTILAIFV